VLQEMLHVFNNPEDNSLKRMDLTNKHTEIELLATINGMLRIHC